MRNPHDAALFDAALLDAALIDAALIDALFERIRVPRSIKEMHL